MTQSELALLQLKSLSTQLRREANKYLFWGKFKGNIKIEGTWQNNDLDLSFSEMPIEVNRDLYLSGFGNTMILPTKREYSGNPKFGDDLMKGFEEQAGYTWTQIHYNQIRHAINIRKGRQQELVERALQAAKQEMPALARYFAKLENWNVTTAIYQGLSENLYAPAANDGLGLSRRYHPNFYYVASQTALTRPATAGKFTTAANLNTADDAVTAAGGTDSTTGAHMTTAVLEMLREYCMNLNIAPIVSKSGNQFWLLIAHPKQCATLRKDSNWLAAQREAIVGRELADNAIFNGSIGIYAGFVVFEDATIVRGWDQTGIAAGSDDGFLGKNNLSTPTYVDLYSAEYKYNRRFNPIRTTDTNRCAIVLGKSALGYVEADPLEYIPDDDDYRNWKGLAGATSYGYARLDQVAQSQLQYLSNSPALCDTVTNDGSLILMTYASAS